MYCSSVWWQSPALSDFLREGDVKFGSVDTSNDKRVLWGTWNFSIPHENYEDIQDLYYDVYKIKKAGMATMAAQMIDPWYKDMKKKVHWTIHRKWNKKKLDMKNIMYAAIDGFVALELYRVLKPMSDAVKILRRPGREAMDHLVATRAARSAMNHQGRTSAAGGPRSLAAV